MVKLVAAGVLNNAAHAANGASDGDKHAQEDAHPGGTEVEGADLGLFEHQPDAGGQPEGGWARAQGTDEAHEVAEEGDGDLQAAMNDVVTQMP